MLRAEKESMKSAASGNSGGGLVSSTGSVRSCKDHLDRDHEHGNLREDGADLYEDGNGRSSCRSSGSPGPPPLTTVTRGHQQPRLRAFETQFGISRCKKEIDLFGDVDSG